MEKRSKLTELQRRFCEEYIARKGNATAAYEAAGYKSSTPVAARAHASRLVAKGNIQAHIYKLREQASKAAIAPLTEIVEHLSYIARSDISDSAAYSDSGMTVEDIRTLPKEIRAAIASIEFIETETERGTTRKKSIKLHSKTAAASLLFQYYGTGTDLNQAIATLKRYGIAMIPDDSKAGGWNFEFLAD